MLFILLRRKPFFRQCSIAICLVALGFFAAQVRAHQVMTPLLTHELHNRIVEGTIAEIEPAEEKAKLVISHLVIEDVPADQTPDKIRITFRKLGDVWQIGDHIRFRANLYPLPSPVMPGSYDFARHFYFKNIGGNGFAFGAPTLITTAEPRDFWDTFNNMRRFIGDNIRTSMPEPIGAVAAAMTVGEMGPIPEETKISLRDSGLAHMLSISGLHLAIAAGFVFFIVRFLLNLYPPFALRLPVKKIAACFALASAAVYLLLAGSPVPAQRAFIMVAFLFVSILVDRRGITLRNLVIAAMAILLFFPEAMFGASFQMSFAATLAIVALYESGGLFHTRMVSWPRRLSNHALGIVFTSLVATLATASFILYHFNRFAVFGIISNMIVVPLATFIMMPGMVIALALMPLGWQEVGYFFLGWGTDIMISVSAWVTTFPYASLYLASPTEGGLAVAAFGILWMCFVTHRARYAGIVIVVLGLSTSLLHRPADVYISDNAAQVMVRLTDGNYTLLKGTDRSFRVKNWLRAEGYEEATPLKETAIACDKIQCLYEQNGHRVILIKKPEMHDVLAAACTNSVDVLIAYAPLETSTCPAPKNIIGQKELQAYGAHTVRFDDKGTDIAFARDKHYGKRLWQPQYDQPEYEEY